MLDYLRRRRARRARRARACSRRSTAASTTSVARGADVLLAGVESGELDVRDDEVGEALLADVVAPYPRLADSSRARSRRAACSSITGGIEAGDLPWLPRLVEGFVLETRPAEHFSRQIELFSTAVRELGRRRRHRVARRDRRIAAGGDLARRRHLPSSARAQLRAPARAPAPTASRWCARGGAVFVDHGSIESGLRDSRRCACTCSAIARSSASRAKRVKLRAVKEGVPVTLADLKVGDYVVHAVHGIGQYLGLRTETILGATSDYLDLQLRRHRSHAGAGAPDASGHEVQRERRRRAAALARWAAPTGRARRRASPRSSRRSPTGSSSCTPSARSRAAMRSRPTRRGRPNSKRRSRTNRRPIKRRRSTKPSATWSARGRWTASSAATSATARPKSRCARVQGDRRQEASRACSCRRRCSPRSTTARSARASRRFRCAIEELSRFKTKKEAAGDRSTTLAEGKVDVVVGTHRLLQKDVVFRDLGLIVVDEEQRFGVMHKERLKQMRRPSTC